MNPYSYTGLLNKGLSLTKTINWASLLDGTQKTLGVINQAIPVYYQVKPLFSNAKTLFKIANVMNDTPKSSNNLTNTNYNSNSNTTSTISNSLNSSIKNSPIFYI